MKKQSYSYWNLVTINVGTMIGVGIFFKNPKVLAATNNIWLALAAWIIGAILVFGLGLSFAEAQSYTQKQNISGTVPNWVEVFIGPKTGRVAQQVFGWLYYPLFSVLLVYYAIYFFLVAFGWTGDMIEAKWQTVWGLSTVAYFALSAGNALSYSFGKVLQMTGTIIKFIPLLAVVILGFAAPVVATEANTFAGVIVVGKDTFKETWEFARILAALPAVFFAFDAFAGGLALSKEERTPGDATKATLFSIVSVAIFYVAFAAAVGWGTNDASLFPLFKHTFGIKGGQALYILIGISAYTVANGMNVAGSRVLKAMADEKAFIPSKLLSKVEADGRHAGQTWVSFVIGLTYMSLMFLIAKITPGGKIESTFDNFGNAVTLFGFALYALIGFGVFSNRFSNKYNVVKQKYIGLQVAASTMVLWVVVQNTVNYFLAKDKTVMWLVIFALFVIFITNKIASLGNKHYS